MTFIGVLQTGDIDEAIITAEKYRAKGQSIRVSRFEYPLPDRFFNEPYPGPMFEHELIEYEVHAEFPERSEA